MGQPIRLHLDEHIHIGVLRGLRLRGINVTSTSDAGLLGAPDEEHIQFAMREGRVIVTNDADFLRLDRRGALHWGIIYCTSQMLPTGTVVTRIADICASHDDDALRGKIVFLTHSRL